MTLVDTEPAEPDGSAGSARPGGPVGEPALPLDLAPPAADGPSVAARHRRGATRPVVADAQEAALPFDLGPQSGAPVDRTRPAPRAAKPAAPRATPRAEEAALPLDLTPAAPESAARESGAPESGVPAPGG